MVKCIFIDGAISSNPFEVLETIIVEQIGATAVFKGSVRADKIDDKVVTCIDFSTQKEIAHSLTTELLNTLVAKYSLFRASIAHSIGEVKIGETCFLVEVKASHRKEAFLALTEIVDEFKAKVPVFGKEIFEDRSYVWKQNRK